MGEAPTGCNRINVGYTRRLSRGEARLRHTPDKCVRHLHGVVAETKVLCKGAVQGWDDRDFSTTGRT